MKAFLAVACGVVALVFLRMVVHNHDNLFVAAEAVHALGISILIYKLTKENSCAGSYIIYFCVFACLVFLYFNGNGYFTLESC